LVFAWVVNFIRCSLKKGHNVVQEKFVIQDQDKTFKKYPRLN